jgi:hypothetical protein
MGSWISYLLGTRKHSLSYKEVTGRHADFVML